jgi:hypothetical protein
VDIIVYTPLANGKGATVHCVVCLEIGTKQQTDFAPLRVLFSYKRGPKMEGHGTTVLKMT